MNSPKRIGIAVVECSNRYLVGIRKPGVPLEGFAEFPGGKCHEHESPFECAMRECWEETGLQIKVDKLLDRREFEYPHGRVDLHFVLCHPLNPLHVNDQHGHFHWATIAELNAMRFPDANSGILELLMNHKPGEL